MLVKIAKGKMFIQPINHINTTKPYQKNKSTLSLEPKEQTSFGTVIIKGGKYLSPSSKEGAIIILQQVFRSLQKKGLNKKDILFRLMSNNLYIKSPAGLEEKQMVRIGVTIPSPTRMQINSFWIDARELEDSISQKQGVSTISQEELLRMILSNRAEYKMKTETCNADEAFALLSPDKGKVSQNSVVYPRRYRKDTVTSVREAASKIANYIEATSRNSDITFADLEIWRKINSCWRGNMTISTAQAQPLIFMEYKRPVR